MTTECFKLVLFDAPNKEVAQPYRERFLRMEKEFKNLLFAKMAQEVPPPPPVPRLTTQEKIDCLDKLFDMAQSLAAGNMCDRDRIFWADKFKLVSDEVISENKPTDHPSDKEVTVSVWLSGKGILGRSLRDAAPEFGKVAAEVYREIHHENPPRKDEYVDGRLIPVNCYYTPKDSNVLEIAFKRWRNENKKLIKNK